MKHLFDDPDLQEEWDKHCDEMYETMRDLRYEEEQESASIWCPDHGYFCADDEHCPSCEEGRPRTVRELNHGYGRYRGEPDEDVPF